MMAIPSSNDYARNTRNARIRVGVLCFLLALVCAYTYTMNELDTLIVPAILLTCFMIPLLLWRYPKFSLYCVFASVCLFEALPLGMPDIPTAHVPFFWNINTIIQIYGHMDGHLMPLNLFEVFILLAAVSSAVRSVYSGTAKVVIGQMFWPILIYIVFVSIGWIHGLFTGGDFKISMQEVRSQFYLLLAYMIGLNSVGDRQTLKNLQWVMVIAIGFKACNYALRRFIDYAGQPLPDQGVGSHEEAFFFNSFIVFFVVSLAYRPSRALFYTVVGLLPIVVMGDLACNRRTGTAALVIVLPILVTILYKTMPEVRKKIAIISFCFLIFSVAYYQAFKNSGSMLAEPARAVKSQFDPDSRDTSSNQYRDAEDADLMATIKLSPIIGYGYGKPMLHAVPIADISSQYEFWDIVTHNQILWVWMRVGSIGFVCFWLMVCGVIIYGIQRAIDPEVDRELQALSIYTVLVFSMLIVFGLLDLQLTNYRDMLFAGLWIGMMVGSSRFGAIPDPIGQESGIPTSSMAPLTSRARLPDRSTSMGSRRTR